MAHKLHEEVSHHFPPTDSVSSVKHSRLLTHTFDWKMASMRALQHTLYRSTKLRNTNVDYRIKYPHECKGNLPKNECHPEAEKRIMHDHKKILEKALIPIVDRPKRMNRLV